MNDYAYESYLVAATVSSCDISKRGMYQVGTLSDLECLFLFRKTEIVSSAPSRSSDDVSTVLCRPKVRSPEVNHIKDLDGKSI